MKELLEDMVKLNVTFTSDTTGNTIAIAPYIFPRMGSSGQLDDDG